MKQYLPTDTLLISIPTRVALIWSPAKAQFVGSSLTVIPGQERKKKKKKIQLKIHLINLRFFLYHLKPSSHKTYQKFKLQILPFSCIYTKNDYVADKFIFVFHYSIIYSNYLRVLIILILKTGIPFKLYSNRKNN